MNASLSPLVSIALPVYNGEPFLAQTLESLLAQDYPNFELVITDNASTDGTEETCQRLAKRDSRVRYFRNPANVGMMANGNRALALCSGEFILLAGAHDLYDSRFIQNCVQVFRSNPRAVLCATRIDCIDEKGRHLSTLPFTLVTEGLRATERFRRTVHDGTAHYAICGMIRAGALRAMQGSRPIPEVFFPDYVMVADLALRGEIVYTGEATMFLRTFLRRDLHEGERENVKIARLISPARARGMKGWIFARFPFLHAAFHVLRALYASNLPVHEKLKLTPDAAGLWKTNILRELTTRWIPAQLRKRLKTSTRK